MMSSVTICSVVSLVIITLAFFFVVVGVATDGWVANGEWSPKSIPALDDPKGKAAYALGIFSAIGASMALVAMGTELAMKVIGQTSEELSHVLIMVTLIAAELGGVCGIIGSMFSVVVMEDKRSKSSSLDGHYFFPGYSFFLTIIGSFILGIGGALNITTAWRPASKLADKIRI